MRFSIVFSRAYLILLWHLLPIWAGIALLICLIGLLIGYLEEDLSSGNALYFAWVTGTTVGYGDLLPTTGISRLLAIVLAFLGAILTGVNVAIAIEAAKIAVENSISIQDFREAVKESTQRRTDRNRR